jgi:ribosome maturation factor RimP
MSKLPTSLQTIILPVVESLGYEFWGGYYAGQGSRALLRIFLDKADGVTLDDCQRVSQQLSAVLDVEEIISHQYVLEVSSPGLDRPLFTLDQFKRFIGHDVRLKLTMPINGQARFVGKIVSVDHETLILDVAEKKLELPFTQIEKANLR